jgi:uncharacterized FlaG/YvyC family protein
MVSIMNTNVLSGYQGNGVAYDRTPIHPGRSNSPLSSRGSGVDWFRERKGDVAQRIGEGIDRVLIRGDMRLEFEASEERGDIMMRVIQKRTGQVIREIPIKLLPSGPVIIDETV